MAKINFTEAHLTELEQLALLLLFSGSTIKGPFQTNYTVFDMFHNTTINTLVNLNVTLKKEIEKIESLDEWSLDAGKQQQLNRMKETQRFVNLLIGYRKFEEQRNTERSKLSSLKQKRAELKLSTMTPAEQLAEIDAEIAKLEGNGPAVTAPQETPAQEVAQQP